MDGLNTRVVMVMEKFGLTKTAFAADLEISQAVLTHISGGRNKPSVEMLQKITHKYPSINTEWLLMGKGTMLKGPDFDKDKLLQALQIAENRLQNTMIDLKTVTDLLNNIKSQVEK
jgi:transcriptional regulator with XRE-family HTH domain